MPIPQPIPQPLCPRCWSELGIALGREIHACAVGKVTKREIVIPPATLIRTQSDGPHITHMRPSGPTRARPAMAALSPRTDGSPSLLAATSTAKKLTEARALRKTEISKMPTIFFSPPEPRAQPSSPGDIEACGTTPVYPLRHEGIISSTEAPKLNN
jgi:hypothetical protein